MDYINHVKQQPIQGIAGFGGGATGAAFRSGQGPMPDKFSSLSQLMSYSPSDGKYTFNLSGGTGTDFEAYVITRDGGWVKALAYYGGNNMSGSSALNAGGNWTDQEQGNYYGKLHSSDMNALMTTSKFLFRVHGGSDTLLNDGNGSGRYEGGQALSNWGTGQDPTSSYGLDLDLTSNGTYDYQTTYTDDTRALCTSCCSHIANIWVSDHNFNATGTLPTGTSHPICWTFGTTHVHTNLHWMAKDNSSSGGTVSWGGSGSGTGFQLFLK